jgi:hypothetical protein
MAENTKRGWMRVGIVVGALLLALWGYQYDVMTPVYERFDNTNARTCVALGLGLVIAWIQRGFQESR